MVIALGTNVVTKSCTNSSLIAPNDRFFHSTEYLLVYPSVFQKLDFNVFFCRTRNTEHGIFLSFAIWNIYSQKVCNTRYFKVTGAIDPEPKQMEYFKFCAP